MGRLLKKITYTALLAALSIVTFGMLSPDVDTRVQKARH